MRIYPAESGSGQSPSVVRSAASGLAHESMAPQSNREVEILLLEDNPADADLFRRSMHGRYRLTVASSGAEALDRLFHRGKYAKEKTPDIIVLDLNVPLLN